MSFDLSIERQPTPSQGAQGRLAEAVGEVITPGRRAAKCRIGAILPVIASRLSRRAAGALVMIILSVTIACVRLLTAVSRVTLMCWIISTELVPDFGAALA